MENTKPPIDFSGDAEASSFESMSQQRLETLAALTKEARDTEYMIEKIQKELDEKSARLRELLELKIPDIMVEMNMTEIRLTTGERLLVKKFYGAHITEEKQAEAFKWLRENGHDAIIKNKVEGSFGKGEDAAFEKVMAALNAHYPGVFTSKTSVHASTLKSFVKEMLEGGQTIPVDLFGVHVGNKVTIK